MRCPICGSGLQADAVECPVCQSRILPPPPQSATGAVAFIEDNEAPSKWPLLLSLLGIAAAALVIFLAVRPFLDDEPDYIADTAAPTTVAPGVVPSGAPVTVGPAETTVAPAETTTAAPAPVVPAGPVAPTGAEATCTARGSTDSRGNPVDFKPENTVDGDTASAWRCEGSGQGVTITYPLAGPTHVVQLGAIPGYARIDPYNGDDRFVENRRVSSARWICLDAAGAELGSAPQNFADDRSMQTIDVTGFDACSAVRVEITGSTQSSRRDFVAISEVTIIAA